MTKLGSLPLLTWFIVGLFFSQAHAQELPKHPLTEQARSAYNAGEFERALKLFVQLSHHFPKTAGVYRALAASANNAKAFQTAVRAYSIFLELSPTGEDSKKARAELENVRRHAQGDQNEKWRQIDRHHTKLLEILRNRSDDRSTKALNILSGLTAQGYFGTDFKTLQSKVLSLLEEKLDGILTRYWSVKSILDAQNLLDLDLQLKETSKGFEDSIRMRNLVQSLQAVIAWQASDSSRALNTLKGLDRLDYRLRYMLASALAKTGQEQDSAILLRALAEQRAEPRLRLIADVLRLKAKRRVTDEDLDSILEMLDTLPGTEPTQL